MTALDAARSLADRWPANAMISPETGLPVCIETTRHVVEAFHSAGVTEVQPMPCALHIYNAHATAQVIAGGLPVSGAVKIEVSPEACKARKTRGWRGHLVVAHPEFLLDLVLPGVVASTGAINKGFGLITAFCGEKGNELVEVDGSWMAMTTDGLCIRFEPRPRMASWRNTDAWRGPVDMKVVRGLAKEIKERL